MRRGAGERRREPEDGSPWWRDAVCYQVCLACFADADADGIGDLEGVRSRLGYLELLGVDVLGLSAPHHCPAGTPATVGVCEVHPRFGDLAALERLLSEAHAGGLRVVLDLAPRPADLTELDRTLRCWLDRGVDGLRVDLAAVLGERDDGGELYRTVRKVLDEYPAAVLAGWAPETAATVPGQDGAHLSCHPALARSEFAAAPVRAAIERSLTAVPLESTVDSVSGGPVWTLHRPGHPRPVSRYGGAGPGTDRARAMALVTLALPGAVQWYNGEELGLPSGTVTSVTPGLSAPGPAGPAPLPWEGAEPPFAFSGSGHSWLPAPPEWAGLSVAAQLEDTGSTLSLYRRALELRREHRALRGTEVEWYGAPEGCLAFRHHPGGLICALNASAAPIMLPRGDLLLCSAELDEGRLPPDAAAWLAPRG